MPQYADLDRLEVLTRITGYLTNLTPLRVGVGKEPPLGSISDLTLLKIRLPNGEWSPYIPGSSLKGVLRSLAESILNACGERVHNPWEYTIIDDEANRNDYCLICGIFGSTRIAGHIRVYDAYPEDGSVLKFLKTGVGINRDFGGSHPRILYTEELVAPYTKWKFMMDIVNIRVFPKPGDERGRLLRQLLQLLASGMVQVGARRTVGYGLVRLEQGRYEVYEVKEGLLVKTAEGGVV